MNPVPTKNHGLTVAASALHVINNTLTVTMTWSMIGSGALLERPRHLSVLLCAKMEALDRGVDFPVQDDLVCERCRQVFASLDVGADACRSLRGRTMPAALRKSIEKAMRASSGSIPARKSARK